MRVTPKTASGRRRLPIQFRPPKDRTNDHSHNKSTRSQALLRILSARRPEGVGIHYSRFGKSANDAKRWLGINPKHRAGIEKFAKIVAKDRFHTDHVSPELLDEVIALWKTQRREFHRISQEAGFQRVNQVNQHAPFAILAMTANGSLIAITPPDADGKRAMRYIPMSLHSNRPYEFPSEFLVNNLKADGETPVINSRYYHKLQAYWRTSGVVALAIHASAEEQLLWDTQQNIAGTIIEAHEQSFVDDDNPA